MFQNKVLFIGLVWPEPTSSAAGKRILQLVEFFCNQACEVTFATAASKSDSSFDFSIQIPFQSVKEVAIELNHSSFDEFIHKLQPDWVIYDRFVSEEQFGWRVSQHCPNAVQILDTEDLHLLRLAREKAYKSNSDVDYFNEIALREIASILRCDLSLMISKVEIDLLKTQFQIPATHLFYLPFLEKMDSNLKFKTYDERKDFVFIGNFLHEPNWQTVLKLKKEIWPLIRSQLKDAQLHIYGAYPSQKVWDLHKAEQGFLVHGRADDSLEVISKARVLLAPIPFGAGQKGKFIDAMQTGTPFVSSSIGVEAMFEDEIPGLVCDDSVEFAHWAASLYRDETQWNQLSQSAAKVLKNRFDADLYLIDFTNRLEEISSDLKRHRNQNFVGQILKANTLNALKYMSLWIETKNA